MTVTLSTKRYVFECVGCKKLAESSRRDTMTCSGACRVKAHRNGAMKALRVTSENIRVPITMMVHGKAVTSLCPELVDSIMAGDLTIEDAMPHAVDAYDRLILEYVVQLQGDSDGAA